MPWSKSFSIFHTKGRQHIRLYYLRLIDEVWLMHEYINESPSGAMCYTKRGERVLFIIKISRQYTLNTMIQIVFYFSH